MSLDHFKPFHVFAPAKINLFLHVTGRLDDGYHTLDSLVGFVDVGDQIDIEPSQDFSFSVGGPFANRFSDKELDCSPHSANLVVRAVWTLAQAAKKIPNMHVRLTKNLPVAAGIGGGSSDAAAVIWGLAELWNIPGNTPYLKDMMVTLGADVPMCFECQPARTQGIGDHITPVNLGPERPVVLVNPGKTCSTAQVFAEYCGKFKAAIDTWPDTLDCFDALIDFLNAQENDLYSAARLLVPDIDIVLDVLRAQEDCALARMSGSGATCFGLFEREDMAAKAAQNIANKYPDWWVQQGWLNRPERY